MSTATRSQRGRKGKDLDVPAIWTPELLDRKENVIGALQCSQLTSKQAKDEIAKLEAEATTIALEPWKELFDPRRTSIKQFVESFKVQTKRARKEPGRAATTNVAYREREAQAMLREEIERQWAPHDPETCIRNHPDCKVGHGACVIVLKDRTQGISEQVQRLIVERVCRGGGGKAKVVSHKEEATLELYGKIRHVRRQIPEWALLHANNQAIEADSKNTLLLVRSGVETSSVHVMTCGDGAMGRGGDFRWGHISEFPWWERGRDGLGGFLESWDDSPGNFVVIESTGKEMDEFYDMCMAGLEGRGRYVVLFFSWLTHPEKTSAFFSASDERKFMAMVGKESRYGTVEEVELRDVYGATPGQIKWRREKIDSIEIKGDLQIFRREHPTKPGDAFLAKSAAVLPKEIVTGWMNPPRSLAKRMDDEALVGDLLRATAGTYEWARENVVERENATTGAWRIYRKPEPGIAYTWGADVAEGFEMTSDGKTEADYSTILVREVLHPRKRICAIFEGHIRTDLFAAEILKAAIYYGHCRGYVERNNHGYSVIQEIENLGASELLLVEQRLTPDTKGRKAHIRKLGFFSSAPSKAKALDLVKRWLYDLGQPKDGAEPEIPLCLARQYMRYERIARGIKRMGSKVSSRITLGATQGHDDLVCADYMAMAAIDVLRREVRLQSTVRPKMSDADRHLLQILRARAAQESESYQDPDMGTMF